MYCRNCGESIPDNAEICMKCGVPTDKGKNYCPFCGQSTFSEAVMCVSCGAGLVKQAPPVPENQKDAFAAGLLALFLGCFGVHDFYLGYKGRGFVKLALIFWWLLLTLIFVILAACGIATSWAVLGLSVVFTVLGCITMSAAGIWALVDAILLLCGLKKTDARGNQLKQF